jgi:HlyD family secretion protein
VVTIADMSTLEVEADVSESNLSKAQMGAPVEITLDALPQLRLRGAVVSIVPTVDRAKATVMTKIRFEKLDDRILPEMSAKVTVLSKPASEADQKPVLAANPQAIAAYQGQKVVWKIQNNEAQPVNVSVGRKLLDQLEIKGDLNSGDKLVLLPSADLKPGARVAVVTK